MKGLPKGIVRVYQSNFAKACSLGRSQWNPGSSPSEYIFFRTKKIAPHRYDFLYGADEGT